MYSYDVEKQREAYAADIKARRDAMILAASKECGRELTLEEWLAYVKEKREKAASQ